MTPLFSHICSCSKNSSRRQRREKQFHFASYISLNCGDDVLQAPELVPLESHKRGQLCQDPSTPGMAFENSLDQRCLIYYIHLLYESQL